MKCTITILGMIVLMLFPSLLAAQVDFTLNDWGRLRLYDAGDVRIIDRVSIDFGVNDSTVYHYKDVGWVDPISPPAALETPTIADSEVVGTMTYNTGDTPIPVDVKHHVYWWAGKNYYIAQVTVYNRGAEAIPSYISFDVIPQVAGDYGNEFVDYDAANEIGYAYKEGAYVGVKLLSHTVTSFRSEFYSDYSAGNTFPDSLQWVNMISGENSTYPFDATSDGSANFLNAGAFNIAAGDSVHFFLCLTYGESLAGLQNNVMDAKIVYNQYFNPATDIIYAESLPTQFYLSNNYPNPFNPVTHIEFNLPKSGDVSLRIFNIQGQLVKTIVKGYLNSGIHAVSWDGTNDLGKKVASGIYIYQLHSADFVQSKRMLLLK